MATVEAYSRLVEVSPHDLEQIEECPSGQIGQSVVLYQGISDMAFRIVTGEWTLHQCNNCGSAFLSPRLTPRAIGRAYEGGYYTHSSEETNEPTIGNPL